MTVWSAPFQATTTTRDVLRVLRDLTPGEWTWAHQLSITLVFDRASAKKILERLARVGWCEFRHETADAALADGRSQRRRYYRLTDVGRKGIEEIGWWLG